MATDETADPVAAELARLTERVGALSDEVRDLRGAPPLPSSTEPSEPVSYRWVNELQPPIRRNLAPVRFVLEAAFLAGAAALAAVAELDPLEIAGVMLVAWVLVALIELLASRAERRRNELPAAPIVIREQAPAADPAWFAPPVERTFVQPPQPADSDTAVTRLPDVEATIEARPS